jgi:hypothetical protein
MSVVVVYALTNVYSIQYTTPLLLPHYYITTLLQAGEEAGARAATKA